MNSSDCSTVLFRYVDDTFTLFRNKDTAFKFLHYLNTIDFERNSEIRFLDVSVKCHDNNSFSTSIYRKKTFTGLYTKWDSFTPQKYKINLIRTLTRLFAVSPICSSSSLLQSALNDLKILLSRNRPFPHSNKQWHRIEVRVDKNTRQMYENVHPSLALVLLFVRTEVECAKGLLLVFT